MIPLSKSLRVIGFAIGLENYQDRRDQMPRVHYAHKDAEAFAQALHKIYSDAEICVEVLRDADASKGRLEYELQETIRGLTKEDLFVFYYAGHGYHDTGGNRITAWDSSAWNAETTLLVRQVLLDPLQESACTRALLFIDACASSVQSIASSRDVITNLEPGELRSFLGNARYCSTFLSCSPKEKSYPSDDLQHGIWTHFLLKALQGAAPEALGPGRFLTDVGLRDYLRTEVPRYIKESTSIASTQTPMAVLQATNTVGLLEVPVLPSKTVIADRKEVQAPSGATCSSELRLPRGTSEVAGSRPSKVNPRHALLTFVGNGSAEDDSTLVASLTLTTDEPGRLSTSISDIKRQLMQDVLLDRSTETDATLATLLRGISTRSRVLDWLATTPFAAHLYFSSRAALANEGAWPETRKKQEFFVLPLVHRLSDKSITIEKLVSNVAGIESYLDTAIAEIKTKFHRDIPRPSIGKSGRNPDKALMELAELVLSCCSAYLLDPVSEESRTVFAHVRTRLKYAANVTTGERHTRDKNPLP